MKIQYKIRVRKAERSTHTPGLYMVEFGPDSFDLAGPYSATSWQEVRGQCEHAARVGLEKGWPACEASASFIGPRKPNGWDANRASRSAILDASAVAAT